MKVQLLTQVWLNPWAQCHSCPVQWPSSRNTLTYVKEHVRAHPTHEVLTVHEKRSVYGTNQ